MAKSKDLIFMLTWWYSINITSQWSMKDCVAVNMCFCVVEFWVSGIKSLPVSGL